MLNMHVHVLRFLEQHFDRFCGVLNNEEPLDCKEFQYDNCNLPLTPSDTRSATGKSSAVPTSTEPDHGNWVTLLEKPLCLLKSLPCLLTNDTNVNRVNCDYRNNIPVLMKRHTQTREKPYSCSLCDNRTHNISLSAKSEYSHYYCTQLVVPDPR